MSNVKSIIEGVIPNQIATTLNILNDTQILGKHGGAYLTRDQSYKLDRFCRLNHITIVVGSDTLITLMYRGNKVCSIQFTPTAGRSIFVYYFDYAWVRRVKSHLKGKNPMMRNQLYLLTYSDMDAVMYDIQTIMKNKYPSFKNLDFTSSFNR